MSRPYQPHEVSQRAKKDKEQNIVLLKELKRFVLEIKLPTLIGVSKKRFLTNYDSSTLKVHSHLDSWSTASATTFCVLSGAHLLRVHDVNEMKLVVDVANHLRE